MKKVVLLITLLTGLLVWDHYWVVKNTAQDLDSRPETIVIQTNNVAGSDSTYLVTQVIDGDTIEVQVEEEVRRVRYIGIDTPEVYPPERVECFGSEASTFNNSLVSGQYVRLVKDVRDIDDYGRLLRYVYVGETFINEKLVSEGYAEAVVFPPDTTFSENFAQLEKQAKSQNKGLWQVCGENNRN